MSDEKAEVTNEILRYLIDNPDARDTVDGIVHWWLLGTKKYSKRVVEAALKTLVEEKLLIAHQRRVSPNDYRLNRRKRKKIISLLQKK
jgi:hypothetical protein